MIGCQYDRSERCRLLLSVELITSSMADYDIWYSDVDDYQQLQATQMNVEHHCGVPFFVLEEQLPSLDYKWDLGTCMWLDGTYYSATPYTRFFF